MRRSKVEACMICEATPCECGKTKVASKRPIKKTTTAARTRQLEKNESDQAELVGPERTQSPSSPSRSGATDEQLVLVGAIRALAPILHPQEIARYRGILSSPPSVKERSAVWKARRQDGLARSQKV